MGSFLEKFKHYMEYKNKADALDRSIEQLEDSKIAFQTERVDIADIDHNADIDTQIADLNHERSLVSDNIKFSKEELATALGKMLKDGQYTDIEFEKKTYRLKFISDEHFTTAKIDISEID